MCIRDSCRCERNRGECIKFDQRSSACNQSCESRSQLDKSSQCHRRISAGCPAEMEKYQRNLPSVSYTHLKQENMFGTLQMGYNPNRERVFLFANLKTSRYDTVASRYQREMKEYQQKSLLKGNNENRAYVSKRWEMASVLIEKKENKPWTR